MLFYPQSLSCLSAQPNEGGPKRQRGDAAKRKSCFGGHARDDQRRDEPADQNNAKNEKAEKHRLAAAQSGAVARVSVIYADGNALWFRLRGQRVTDRIQYRLYRTHCPFSRHKPSPTT